MKTGALKDIILAAGFGLMVSAFAVAQQDLGPIRGNAGQASQPSGTGVSGQSPSAGTPSQPTGASSGANAAPAPSGTSAPPTDASTTRTGTNAPQTDHSASSSPKTDTTSPQGDASTPQAAEPQTVINPTSNDPNANNPILEPAPLPNTKPTLIGGTAARVDHVRNQLTIQPFGGGQKIKVFIDERTNIYRNGEQTTVLGIRKNDRVYADTMLDGSRVFAKNVRVETEPGVAEVRGQVTGVNPEKGTITVRDGISSQPVTIMLAGNTQYSALKGSASQADLQPGSMVDVQFAPGKDKHDAAKEVVLLAKPGDTYVFSGVVTNIDLRNNTLALENRSDDQTYELHFDQSAVDDKAKLKVGSEVTAHVVFNGKQYNANDLQLQAANNDNAEQSDKSVKAKEQ